MEHVVFFPAQDGTPAFRRVASLEDAVRLVEHLRNVEGVAEASVHALTEVPLSFKAYYRVELPSAAPAPVVEDALSAPLVESAPPAEAPAAELEELVPAQAPQEHAPVEEPALVAAAPSAKSLGFFA